MFWEDVSGYLAMQLGTALAAGAPGFIAPFWFRGSRIGAVLAGVIGAILLPAMWHFEMPHAVDRAILIGMAGSIGGLWGLVVYALVGRRRIRTATTTSQTPS